MPSAAPATRSRVSDAALAATLFACSFPGSAITFPGRHPDLPWWPGVLLAAAACAAVVRRRSHPRGTVTVTLACAVAAAALGHPLTVLLLAPLMVALYSLAAGTDRRTANTFAFTGAALLVATGLLAGPDGEPLVLKLLGPTAWLLLPTSLGTVTRLRTAYLDAVRARAEHAERTREEEARRRVTEERMRIARDLHDVVAHHLVLAGLQAGAVARRLPSRPEEASRIVADLADTTASALRELKATVGLLRREGDDAADHTRSPSPRKTPGLAQLAELADSFHVAGGVHVSVRTEGEPRPLTAGADLTAYRIAQEALTNVAKHAGPGKAEVRLVYTDDHVSVSVTDDGGAVARRLRHPSPGGEGYGLIGMRERARSAGGRVRAGHRPEGGFEVLTELPLARADMGQPAESGTSGKQNESRPA
ncbi:sensor histidine kinase [Streptomyces sp. NPDC058335]|uniref:sensor histidine kinase n=1 Tax=Streptomyces sp. NPDC058335 TaxID=3346451 RepID=UPI00365D5CA8